MEEKKVEGVEEKTQNSEKTYCKDGICSICMKEKEFGMEEKTNNLELKEAKETENENQKIPSIIVPQKIETERKKIEEIFAKSGSDKKSEVKSIETKKEELEKKVAKNEKKFSGNLSLFLLILIIVFGLLAFFVYKFSN